MFKLRRVFSAAVSAVCGADGEQQRGVGDCVTKGGRGHVCLLAAFAHSSRFFVSSELLPALQVPPLCTYGSGGVAGLGAPRPGRVSVAVPHQ